MSKKTLNEILGPDADVKIGMTAYVAGRTALAFGVLGIKYIATGEITHNEAEWALILGMPAAICELGALCGLSCIIEQTQKDISLAKKYGWKHFFYSKYRE